MVRGYLPKQYPVGDVHVLYVSRTLPDGVTGYTCGQTIPVVYTIVWSGIHNCNEYISITYLFHDRRARANTGLRTARPKLVTLGHALVE